MKSYVYEHWRPDTEQPFWVGKGTNGRAHLTKRRNKHHTAIVEKLAAIGLRVDVRIIAHNLSDGQAFELEVARMEFWKSRGVKLANQSHGGRGGMSGCKRSPESRAKQSATSTGRKLSPEHRQKIVERVQSPEWKAKNSAVHTGRKRPSATVEKMKAAQKLSYSDPIIGVTRRQAIIARNSGRVTSPITKQKQREAKTAEIRVRLAGIVREKWNEPGERRRRSEAMSKANTGRIVTEQARNSLRKVMLQPERRAKSSKNLKQRWSDPVARQEMSAALSAARIGVPLSFEHVESLKKSWTPERKKIVSEKMKAIRSQRGRNWTTCVV